LGKISRGGVAIIPDFVPSELVTALRADSRYLFKNGQFTPDGLVCYLMINVLWHSNDLSHFFTCNALRVDEYGTIKKQQGFTAKADRKIFRGGAN